jgi:glycosyl hydrolase family 99
MRPAALVTAIVWLCASVPSSTADVPTDPARNLARVRLIVVATAATTDVTIEGATLASYSSRILRAAAGSGASQTGHVLRLTNKAPGQEAEAQFDIILADVVPMGTIDWVVDAATDAETRLDVYSVNDPPAPKAVDRFAARGETARFTTLAALIASHGHLKVKPVAPHLVLAQYYPWYDLGMWRDPQMADTPVDLYSSDDSAALERQAQQAHAAGIDAFVISWQGKAFDWNTRRIQPVLEAARSANMRACVFIESQVVNPTNNSDLPTDPDTMARYLEDIVDLWGSHPAYLRVDNRPVILVYYASRPNLGEAQWKTLLTKVRATGRNPIVIGDFYHSRLINVLDGEYQYINVTLSPADLMTQNTVETLRVRTFDMLTPNDPRRIWVASVCPGMDDRRIRGRQTPVFVDRANGAVYDDQWRSAVTTAADWVIITTWNEFWENTEIEPSVRYGTRFLDLTREWSARFKGLPSPSRRPR